jgi:hypothetical protein
MRRRSRQGRRYQFKQFLPEHTTSTLDRDSSSTSLLTNPFRSRRPVADVGPGDLTITPIYPTANIAVQGLPLELRILAPDATTPPMIIGAAGISDGIVLMFSKPMNPVQASNVHNYTVRETGTTSSIPSPFLGFSAAPSAPRNPQSRCLSARQPTTPQILR